MISIQRLLPLFTALTLLIIPGLFFLGKDRESKAKTDHPWDQVDRKPNPTPHAYLYQNQTFSDGPSVTRACLECLSGGRRASPWDLTLELAGGKLQLWDWKGSGTVELNCLLCHVKTPNNVARIQALKAGRFGWASTATLVDSDLVKMKGDRYECVTDMMTSDGSVSAEHLQISTPHSASCRMCHAKSCRCTDPVVFENSLENWSAETTGEIFSPERMFDSGMNLKDKSSLSRA